MLGYIEVGLSLPITGLIALSAATVAAAVAAVAAVAVCDVDGDAEIVCSGSGVCAFRNFLS